MAAWLSLSSPFPQMLAEVTVHAGELRPSQDCTWNSWNTPVDYNRELAERNGHCDGWDTPEVCRQQIPVGLHIVCFPTSSWLFQDP